MGYALSAGVGGERHQNPWSCGYLCSYAQSNMGAGPERGSPEEQRAVLTAEPPLQPQHTQIL